MSSGYGFLNSHTISQCKDSITFKEIYGGVENYEVSSVYGSIKRNTDLQHNGLKSLMHYNARNDTYMNYTLQNGDVSSRLFLLKSYSLPQYN